MPIIINAMAIKNLFICRRQNGCYFVVSGIKSLTYSDVFESSREESNLFSAPCVFKVGL
jgi:hypothetical protein